MCKLPGHLQSTLGLVPPLRSGEGQSCHSTPYHNVEAVLRLSRRGQCLPDQSISLINPAERNLYLGGRRPQDVGRSTGDRDHHQHRVRHRDVVDQDNSSVDRVPGSGIVGSEAGCVGYIGTFHPSTLTETVIDLISQTGVYGRGISTRSALSWMDTSARGPAATTSYTIR